MSTKHGMYGTPTYKSWQAMKGRCAGRLSKAKYYADKGITVCERWQLFENFYADMGARPEGMTLDRIDPNGHYEPANCRWADKQTQMRNKADNVWLEHNGERRCLTEWSSIVGLERRTLRERMYLGWPVEDILNPNKNFRYVAGGNAKRAANKTRQTLAEHGTSFSTQTEPS
jgi:hypothetical protein